MSSTPEEWYKSLPLYTRIYATIVLLVTVLFTFKVISISFIFLDATLVYRKFHIWRLFTDYLFLGTFGFSWLIEMYFLTTYGSKLEKNEIFTTHGSPGAYLYFLFFNMLTIDLLTVISNWPTGSAGNGRALVFAIIYYWSRREPYQTMSLWGFNIPSSQLPFGMAVFDLMLGNGVWFDILGIASGHLYYFLREIAPYEYRITFLDKTPYIFDMMTNKINSWLSGVSSGSWRTMGGGVHVRHPTEVNAPNNEVRKEPRAFPGSGQRLGSG